MRKWIGTVQAQQLASDIPAESPLSYSFSTASSTASSLISSTDLRLVRNNVKERLLSLSTHGKAATKTPCCHPLFATLSRLPCSSNTCGTPIFSDLSAPPDVELPPRLPLPLPLCAPACYSRLQGRLVMMIRRGQKGRSAEAARQGDLLLGGRKTWPSYAKVASLVAAARH